MKRISKAKRRHLVACAVAMQSWRIDNEEEVQRLAEAVLADLHAIGPDGVAATFSAAVVAFGDACARMTEAARAVMQGVREGLRR